MDENKEDAVNKLLNKAEQLIHDWKYDEALDIYDALLKNNPDNPHPEALYWKCLYSLAQNELSPISRSDEDSPYISWEQKSYKKLFTSIQWDEKLISLRNNKLQEESSQSQFPIETNDTTYPNSSDINEFIEECDKAINFMKKSFHYSYGTSASRFHIINKLKWFRKEFPFLKYIIGEDVNLLWLFQEKLLPSVYYPKYYPILIGGEWKVEREVIARSIHHHKHINDYEHIPKGKFIKLEWMQFQNFNSQDAAACKLLHDYFDLAKNGTLFLDVIELFSLPFQELLQSLLQQVDIILKPQNIRLICSTCLDLNETPDPAKILGDLYARFAENHRFRIPFLKERYEDIAYLACYLTKCDGFVLEPPNIAIRLKNYYEDREKNGEEFKFQDLQSLLRNWESRYSNSRVIKDYIIPEELKKFWEKKYSWDEILDEDVYSESYKEDPLELLKVHFYSKDFPLEPYQPITPTKLLIKDATDIVKVKKNPPVHFPDSKGLKWEEVTMQFVSNDSICITAKRHSHEYTFTEMGFKDKRWKKETPDKQWNLLKLISIKEAITNDTKGIPGDPADIKHKIKILKDCLISFMNIPDNPFHPYTSKNGYYPRFKLLPNENLVY